MFFGPPLPLPPDLPLGWLFVHACPPGLLGAWVRGCRHRFPVYDVRSAVSRRVLISADLGFLLRRCSHIALREGIEPVVVDVAVVIQWRALQVVTATPYLPGLERLTAQFPGLQPNPTGLLVPIATRSPEEVLAECLAQGIPVAGSQIIYSAPLPHPAAPERIPPCLGRRPWTESLRLRAPTSPAAPLALSLRDSAQFRRPPHDSLVKTR